MLKRAGDIGRYILRSLSTIPGGCPCARNQPEPSSGSFAGTAEGSGGFGKDFLKSSLPTTGLIVLSNSLASFSRTSARAVSSASSGQAYTLPAALESGLARAIVDTTRSLK